LFLEDFKKSLCNKYVCGGTGLILPSVCQGKRFPGRDRSFDAKLVNVRLNNVDLSFHKVLKFFLEEPKFCRALV
jgi:hypothetical protein